MFRSHIHRAVHAPIKAIKAAARLMPLSRVLLSLALSAAVHATPAHRGSRATTVLAAPFVGVQSPEEADKLKASKELKAVSEKNGDESGGAGPSALPKGADPSNCVAKPGQTMSTTAWCVENCGDATADPPNCPVNLCVCKEGPAQGEDGSPRAAPTPDPTRSALPPNGDPNLCTARDGQTEADTAWCVANCGTDNCPMNLCTCVKPHKPKGRAAAPGPLGSALPAGADPSGCVAVVGQSSVDDAWCVQHCSMTPPDCPVPNCYCSDDMAIIVFEPEDFKDAPVNKALSHASAKKGNLTNSSEANASRHANATRNGSFHASRKASSNSSRSSRTANSSENAAKNATKLKKPSQRR